MQDIEINTELVRWERGERPRKRIVTIHFPFHIFYMKFPWNMCGIDLIEKVDELLMHHLEDFYTDMDYTVVRRDATIIGYTREIVPQNEVFVVVDRANDVVEELPLTPVRMLEAVYSSEESSSDEDTDSISDDELVCALQGAVIQGGYDDLLVPFTGKLDDSLLKLLEDIMLACNLYMDAFDSQSRLLAILTFCKLRFKGSLINTTYSVMAQAARDIFEVQGFEDKVDDMRVLIREWKNIRDSTMGRKYKTLIGVMCKFGAFSLIGVDPPKNWRGEQVEMTLFDSGDLVFSIIDTLSYTIQRVCIYARTGSWQAFVHGPEQYITWYDESMELRRLTLNMSNLATFGESYHSVVARLKKAIEQGKTIVKYGESDAMEMRHVRTTLNDLMMMEANVITKRATQENRRVPFGVLIHGKSGVAKSSFTNVIGYWYAMRYRLPKGSAYRHNRIFTDKFWSGFSSEQWWIHLDDVALFKHDKLTGPDPTTCDLISTCNPFGFSPPQAAIEDKGKTPMKARLVTATTNTIDMRAHLSFECPLAVRRRLPFVITVEPKPEFSRLDSAGMIDPLKIPPMAGDWPDLWLIKAEKVVAGGMIDGREFAKLDTVRVFSNINEFLDWFLEVTLAFERIQDKALSDDAIMESYELCLLCNRIQCVCVEPLQNRVSNLMDTVNEVLVQNTQGDELDDIKALLMDPPADYKCRDEVSTWFVDHESKITWVYNHIQDELYTVPYESRNMAKRPKGLMEQISTAPALVWEYGSIIEESLTSAMRDEESVIGRTNIRIITTVMSLYTRYAFCKRWSDFALSFSLCRRFVHWYAGKYVTASQGVRKGLWFLGEFAYHSYMKVEWVKILQGLVLATTLWRGYTMTNNFMQGAEMSLPRKVGGDHFKKDEKENVWKNDDYQLTPLDLTPQMVGYSNLPPEQVVNIIARSQAKMFCRGVKKGEPRVAPANALCLGGHLWVTTNHTLMVCDNGIVTVELCRQPYSQGVTTNVKFELEETSILRFPDRDLAFFQCYATDAGKRLIDLIPNGDLEGVFNGVLLRRDRTNVVEQISVRCAKRAMLYAPEHECYYEYWTGRVSVNTEKGDCGSTMIALSPQCMILGLHQLGGSSFIASSLRLDRALVDQALEHFGRPMVQGGCPELNTSSVTKVLGPLHHKSPLRYLKEGVCSVYGSFQGWRPRPRSRVCETILYDTLKDQREWDPQYARPQLDDWRPWHYTLKDIVEQKHNVKESILKECVSSFTADILAELGKEELDKIVVLDSHAAVNGVQGVRFLDKMNFNSSMGEPWCTKKKKFLSPDPTPELPEAKKFEREVMERAEAIERKYVNGERACPVFSGQPKDEVRARKKVAKGELRTFTGAPCDWSIVVRMYLLTFIMVFQNNPLIFEGAPGCVAQSLEWERFRDFLVSFGKDRLVAGDYRKFDKKMIARLIIAAFEVIIGICAAAGWSGSAILVLWGIAEDTAYAWVNFNGDFVQFMGSNPSGHPLTVIINCIVNSLYMRYCYLILNPKKEVRSFRLYVHLLTYGDDNAFGVSRLISWFNHTSIAEVLESIGVGYTMADKEAESVPFIHIDQVSFLKRKWRWDSDVLAYLCPLEEDSIRKSLMYTIPSPNLTVKSHMMFVLHAAVAEFFYYGRDRFEKERSYFIGVVHEMDMLVEYEVKPFPTWMYLCQRFWDASWDLCDESRTPPAGVKRKIGAGESPRIVPEATLLTDQDLTAHNLGFSMCGSVLVCDNPPSLGPAFLGDGVRDAQNKTTPYVSLAKDACGNQIPATQNNGVLADTKSKPLQEALPQVQGDELPVGGSVVSSVSSEQTTQFLDTNLGHEVGYVPDEDYLATSDGVTSAGLAQFLSRPVRIANFTWNESDVPTIKTSINPWLSFFNDTAIKSKMNNFAFIRCNLKLKFIINASPFYYGLMKACYQPLQVLTPSTIVADNALRFMIPYSQRPHVDLHPQLSEGAIMTLPFFLHRSWLRVYRAADFTEMGQLDFLIYVALRSANGVTGQGCSVQVYAWAEDVVLSGPTLSLSMQGDEYGEGVVSAPASTIARIAGRLKGIPVIGKFATATEMGANAISGIAKLFGFTNVPVISDAVPMRMIPFPQFTSPEIGYPTEKLTLDAKNELSIDPSALGLPHDDELSIESLVGRESFLCFATWTTSTAVDTLLFASRVTPLLFDCDSSGTIDKLYLTPLALVARLFESWRGDIIFKFTFVCSPYHKGRVRISYDPFSPTVQTAGDIGSAIFNTIVDLGESRNVEIKVPYQQALQWLHVTPGFDVGNVPFITSGSSLTPEDSQNNGFIVMKSLTLLTAPVAASTVNIIVSVRGAPNMEFANPIQPDNSTSVFTVQGDERVEVQGGESMMPDDEKLEVVEFDARSQMYPERYRINYGECVKSVRQLLRRINYSETFTGVSSTDLDYILWQRHSRFPLFYGYDPNGLHAAVGTVVPASNFPFNFVKNSPYSWLAPCFIAQRGSVNWHYNAECDFPISQFTVTRINGRTGANVTLGSNSRTGATNNPTASFYMSVTNGMAGGASITNCRTQSGLNVSIPNYTQYRFESTNPRMVSKPAVRGTANYDGADQEFVQVQVNCDGTNGPKPQNVKVHKHFGVGTDFSLFFFLNVPTLFVIPSIPAAA